jgi:hypothetical protein
MTGRKKDAGDTIPEDAQKPLRTKLRILRESRGLSKTQAPYAAPSTLSCWENHDISSMRFSAVYRLAEFMGWTFAETFAFFADDNDAPSPADETTKRLQIIFRNLPTEYKEHAFLMLENLVDLAERRGDLTRRVEENIATVDELLEQYKDAPVAMVMDAREGYENAEVVTEV